MGAHKLDCEVRWLPGFRKMHLIDALSILYAGGGLKTQILNIEGKLPQGISPHRIIKKN